MAIREYCRECDGTTDHYVDQKAMAVVCGDCQNTTYAITSLRIEQVPTVVSHTRRDSFPTLANRTDRPKERGLDLR